MELSLSLLERKSNLTLCGAAVLLPSNAKRHVCSNSGEGWAGTRMNASPLPSPIPVPPEPSMYALVGELAKGVGEQNEVGGTE